MNSVWVTRPGKGGVRTSDALRAEGWEVVWAPVLKVSSRVMDENAPAGLPDLVVFVSANAVDGLFLNQEHGRFPADVGQCDAAIIGERTAESLETHGWTGEILEVAPRAEVLMERFDKRRVRPGSRVWIPAGNRKGSARDELPEFFRSRGLVVSIFSVYQTVNRDLEPAELDALGAESPGAVILHSASAAEAVAAMSDDPRVDRWWNGAVMAAVGPTTAIRLRELGACDVCCAAEPNDESLVACVREAFSRSRT